ncbi:MAG: DUF1294 domain-containing protein [Enterobacteriaceae bacterium]|nr:DUF1294 domain-containing protein [Enterobacteriaceae bacterium]
MSKTIYQARSHLLADRITTLFAIFFVLVVAGGFWFGVIPMTIIIVYTISSISAFFLYRADKRAAIKNSWRIKESTLLWCGLLGGWFGALAAQRIYRHKTSKTQFQLWFWLTVIINCAALIWWVMR